MTFFVCSFLQAHSYPVINPDGAEFPPGLWVNRSKVYELHLRSDLQPAYLSVPNPVAGDWFMVAFITEASNRITQAVSIFCLYFWLPRVIGSINNMVSYDC